MDINKIPELTKQIALQYGYPVPRIELYNYTKTIGKSFRSAYLIRLNRKFCEINSEEIIISLIKHEIAHFRFHLHNDAFKSELIRMGCHDAFHGSQLKSCPEIHQVISEPKYIYQCPVGHTYKYQRRMHREGHRSCGKCDPKFNPNFLLRRIG